MLATDYRDAEAESDAEALLVEPGRAPTVPTYANLASAALFLGRRAVGDATTYAGRAGKHPWAGALAARIAIAAGNPEVGLESAAAAVAADPNLAAATAIEGDLARRVRRDATAARTAYAAALSVSPVHPRAVFGMAKLALSSQVPLADGAAPLRRLAADTGTPANERARAALHLAAIELRGGDRPAAMAALDAVPSLDGPSRTWAERAASVVAGERKGYRAVLGAPPVFLSASDDDPAEVPAVEPPPPPPPPKPAVVKPARKPAPVIKKAAAPPARKPAATPAKKPASPPPAKKKPTPATP